MATWAGDPPEKRFWRNRKVAWTGYALLTLALFTACAMPGLKPLQRWIFLTILVLLFFLLAGLIERNRLLGIFINDRNLMSLPRIQIVAWSTLILSAFLTFFVLRLGFGEFGTDLGRAADPLRIAVQPEVFALMGISVGSYVTASAVISSKEGDDITLEAKRVAAIEVFERYEDDYVKSYRHEFKIDDPTRDEVRKWAIDVIVKNSPGTLIASEDAKFAGVRDLVQGDELGSPGFDLGKIQMLFFTVLAILAYGFALGGVFADATTTGCIESDPGCLDAFPAVTEGLAWILGLSHAGYLVKLGSSHTRTKVPAGTPGAARPPRPSLDVDHVATLPDPAWRTWLGRLSGP